MTAYVATHTWWVPARAQGHEAAIGNLEFLSPMMIKEQVVEERELAREWVEAHPSSATMN